MKVFVIDNNTVDESEDMPLGWYLIADSAVSNTGKPFYKPEDLGKVSASLAFAVKICRLGKSIAPKFAPRYYTSVAPALHFRLPALKDRLQRHGKPVDAWANFDRSLFVGEFSDIKTINQLSLELNGREILKLNPDCLENPLQEIVSAISKMNTLKIGDLVLPALSDSVEINEGDRLSVKVNGNDAFLVKVR